MISFIRKIVKSQKGFYSGLLLVLSLLSSFEFVAVVVYFQATLINGFFESLILKIISGIVVMVSFILILFVNNYLIEHKSDEFSLILFFGYNMGQVIRYILAQFGLLFILAYFIGSLLGGIWLTIYQIIADQALVIELNGILSIYLALLLTKLIYVVVIDLGKFIQIKMDIVSYMNHQTKTTNFNPYAVFSSGSTQVQLSKKQILLANIKGMIPVIFGCFLIMIGISGLLNLDNSNNFGSSFVFSLIGELIIINSLIPLMYQLFHNNLVLKSKRAMMVINNLKDVTQNMATMINISAIVVPIIIMFLSLQSLAIEIQNALLMSYIVLIIGMFLCFIIKFMIYIPSRAKTIGVMKAIGYNKQEIYKIHIIEIIIFALLFIIFPIVIYGLVLYQSYVSAMISYYTFVIMLSVYISLYAIMLVYMLISYYRLVKEVYQDVRYLNRGE